MIKTIKNYSIFCLILTLIASILLLLQCSYYFEINPSWWTGSYYNIFLLDTFIDITFFLPLILAIPNIIIIILYFKKIHKKTILNLLLPAIYRVFL